MENAEETNPLIPQISSSRGVGDAETKKEPDSQYFPCDRSASHPAPHGWVAEGVPYAPCHAFNGNFPRRHWNSSILACLGRNDEFFSSDLEVCLLGSFFPCMLYGSNVERLAGNPSAFSSHCLPYGGLYLLGNSLFGWNCLAPWFSYPSRTAIRRKFNLEGSCESCIRSCGCCCQAFIEEEEQREQYETACDFATHFLCHQCALCQEARELRHELPHPGFNGRLLLMAPPVEQTMGRGV